jgi:RND family efflux transporter MFP subunit
LTTNARRRSFVIAVVLALGAAGCSSNKAVQAASTKPPEPLAVTVAAAESRPIDRSIFVTGSLSADESVTISPEVQGRVKAIYFDFGQVVRKGQVVAEIDSTEYQIQLERAKASLAQSLARLGLKPGEENMPPESTAAARQAKAQMEDAQTKYENAAKLVKTGDISRERFVELEKQYAARKAGFEASQDDLRTMWMSMEGLRSDVKLAEKHVNDCTLRAPFNGSVSQKHVSPGQYIKDNTPVISLVKSWPLRLRADVPETAAGSVKPGSLLTFMTDAVSGSEFHATVHELNPSLDPKTRSLTVEARLNESDARLRPGMFVQVRLITDRNLDATVVPRRAVYTIAGLTKLFVIRDGRAIEQHIPPGRDLDGWVEVPAGTVKPGEMVAVSNIAQLVSGETVRAQRR